MRLGFFSNIYRKYYGWRTGSSAAGGSGVLLLFGGRGDLCALRRGEKTTIVTDLIYVCHAAFVAWAASARGLHQLIQHGLAVPADVPAPDIRGELRHIRGIDRGWWRRAGCGVEPGSSGCTGIHQHAWARRRR